VQELFPHRFVLALLMTTSLLGTASSAQSTMGPIFDLSTDRPSDKGRSIHIFDTQKAFAQAIPTAQQVSADDTVLTAFESRSTGMTFDAPVEIEAVLCDPEAVDNLKSSILQVISGKQFHALGPWNAVGFLKARSETYGKFTTPSEYEVFDLLIKIDARPKDLTEYFTLLYELRAGPRKTDASSMTDLTSSNRADDFIGELKSALYDGARGAIASHCGKIDSGLASSRPVALKNLALSAAQEHSVTDKLQGANR
jgi:hypothetical protein